MCLDALEELAELARKAADVKKDHEAFKETATDGMNTWNMDLSLEEADLIYRSRVERAEAKLKSIGWNPPPKRVTEGQRAAELKEAGHTLPGEIPAALKKENEVADLARLSAEQGTS